jgi:hypothetical protein
MNPILIAPCGMNCSICIGYLRDKNSCCGCRIVDGYKPKHCTSCSIINCQFLKESESNFCYDCRRFPCQRLKQLDKRYRTKYNMSMVENLESIREIGLKKFSERETERWKCLTCGGTICVHRSVCIECSKN